MSDIFGKETKFGNTSILTADVLTLSVAGKDTTQKGFLVQNVTLQYNQPLNRIYEVGSEYVYFAPGRPIGSMQIGRIIGVQPLSQLIPAGTGIWSAKDPNAGDRQITLKRQPGTIPGGIAGALVPALTISISGAVIESYGFAADANGLLVQENITIQFAALNFS